MREDEEDRIAEKASAETKWRVGIEEAVNQLKADMRWGKGAILAALIYMAVRFADTLGRGN